MKPNFSSALLLFTLMMTFSCSQKGSNVKLEISHNFAFGNSAALQSIAGGGLMVWGKSSTGDSFAQSLEGTDDLNLQLSNGTWTFYAMAWDGTTNFNGTAMSPGMYHTFGGVQRCAVSVPTTLSGSQASVDLNLSNPNCTDVAFKGSLNTTTNAGNIVLPQTTFAFCRGISQLANGQDICADSLKDTRQKERKAWIGSYKVKLKNFRNIQGSKSINGDISSKCIAMAGDHEIPPSPAPAPATSDSSLYGASSMKISGLPAGGPGMPFYIEVEMFPGNKDCDEVGAFGLRGSLTKHLFNGVTSTLVGSHKYFTQVNSANIQLHKQALQVTNDSICNGRVATNIGDHPFAAGEGLKENPYLICSVPQFHAINSNSGSYLDKHFRLAADIDFNPYSKGLAGTGILPSHFSCLEDGSNFIPVGYPNATCTPGDPLVFNTPVPFTGSFMGSGHKISNLRLRAEEDDFIGMFAKIQSGTVPNDFGDFFLNKAEISGKTNVGAVASEVFASAIGDIKFWKIFAKNLDIESRPDTGTSNVGSLFGVLQYGALEKIQVLQSEVRGDKDYVGGIVGMIVNSTVFQAAAEVNLRADGPSLISGIGGFAGDVTGSALQYVKHEGGIYTNGWYVGGIAGNVNSGTSIENFYTMSFIYSASGNTNLKIGGVVGSWDSTGTFGPGYSLSSIKTNCMSACGQGSIVGYATSTGSTTIYKMNPVETGDNNGALMNNESIPAGGGIVDMRTIANLPALVDSNNNDWRKINNEYPRFDFENHPCTSGMSGTGAGTLLSPSVICHEGQYIGLGGGATGTYQLAGNIRLSNSGSTSSDLSTLNATVLGQNFAILGGHANALGGLNTGHIGTISTSGKLININYFGLSRYSNSGTVLADAHGVLAGFNNGEIRGINIWSFGSYPYYGSLVVGQNNGSIRKLELSGSLSANFEGFASIAVENTGIIEDSKTQNSIACKEGAGCNLVAGLVVKNSGEIKRTEMGTHLNEVTGPFSANTSMLVDNNVSPGKLQDISVREYTEFRTTYGGNYYHRLNSGSLERIYNSGRLIHQSNTYLGALAAGFPSETAAASPGTGTHNDVWRVGANSGQELVFEANYTCSTADVLTISAWGSMPDYTNWDFYMGSGGYAIDGKKMFVHMKTSNDQRKVLRVLTYNGSNAFGVIAGGCPSGTGGKASIYYTNDLAISEAGVAQARVKLPQDSIKANYSPGWQGVMWDESNATDRSQILSFYAYILGISTTPVIPKIWRIDSEGRLELFDMD